MTLKWSSTPLGIRFSSLFCKRRTETIALMICFTYQLVRQRRKGKPLPKVSCFYKELSLIKNECEVSKCGHHKAERKCVEEEKIKDLVTTEDFLFSSSSAANFVLGYSVSGPRTWKDKNGKSLKEIETEKSE
ncbi:MAG: DUF4357 domain-containing protein [Blautia sp.]|jgi:hypothetical protein|nr:DUF4357 domain-containing protein [Blautia sp.]